MPWVCAKIIGDGVSTETAFRTVVQETPMENTVLEGIPVGKDGKPVADFAMAELSVKDSAKLIGKNGCVILPPVDEKLDLSKKVELANALATQNCSIDLTDVTDVQGVVTKGLMEIIKKQKPGEAEL